MKATIDVAEGDPIVTNVCWGRLRVGSGKGQHSGWPCVSCFLLQKLRHIEWQVEYILATFHIVGTEDNGAANLAREGLHCCI